MDNIILGEEDFDAVNSCPFCHISDYKVIDEMPVNLHFFANHCISVNLPVELNRCNKCGLYFKSKIPNKDLLVRLSDKLADNEWEYDDYGYNDIREVIKSHKVEKGLSVMDIGCFNGDFLKKTMDLFDSRSGSDIYEMKFEKDVINGEFITSYVEEINKFKVKKTFDVITMFDVFEHLYDVEKAMDNLYNLLNKDGLLIIETGNAGCKSSIGLGVQNWWYINIFIHHVCADIESITTILNNKSFNVIDVVKKRHKGRLTYNKKQKVKELIKYYMIKTLRPKYYFLLVKKINKYWFFPHNPNENDHMLIVAKKI